MDKTKTITREEAAKKSRHDKYEEKVKITVSFDQAVKALVNKKKD